MAKAWGYSWPVPAERFLPTLPDEAAERLAAAPNAFLLVSGERIRVAAAPLGRQLYLLAPLGAADGLLGDTEAELRAEADAWTLRATGRAALGRIAGTDPARMELAHWLPEGRRAQEFVAVRFYPETIDYAADGRKAAGPVPGVVIPGWWSRWFHVVTRDYAIAFFVGAFIDWGALLIHDDKNLISLALVGVMMLVGWLQLGGVLLLYRVACFGRWRRADGQAEPAMEFVEGWVPPDPARKLALALLVAGVVLNLLLLAAGVFVATITVLAGGALFIAPMLFVRHLGGREDKL